MSTDVIVLFRTDEHCSVLVPSRQPAVGWKQHRYLVADGGEVAIVEPGWSADVGQLVSTTMGHLPPGKRLRHVVVSHRTPEACSALNDWLLATEADAWAPPRSMYASPEAGLGSPVLSRLHEIPDCGQRLPLGASELWILPAHYLPATSNFQIHDPVSRILYTGPLGSSVGTSALVVSDFDAHVPLMEPFHRRSLPSSAALRAWVRMARGLDIDTIAPECGPLFRGPDMVRRFLDWCEHLECGIDGMPRLYQPPG